MVAATVTDAMKVHLAFEAFSLQKIYDENAIGDSATVVQVSKPQTCYQCSASVKATNLLPVRHGNGEGVNANTLLLRNSPCSNSSRLT